MRVLLAYVHHRRCLQWYYKRALARLGHEVISVGPWDSDWRFGTYGREPDVRLPMRMPLHYEFNEVCLQLPWVPDLTWLIDGGNKLRMYGVRGDFVHTSLEGTDTEWSRGVTPHRYVNFTCNGSEPPDVTFMPYGFDPIEAGTTRKPIAEREYDCVQVGSARPMRAWLWDQLLSCRGLHCRFLDDLWGPAHFALYQDGRSTFCNQTLDFMCPRVFDAMGMGCLLISDRTPSLLSLFDDGVHFVGYEPQFMGNDPEGIPNVAWIAEVIARCRYEPAWAEKIASEAHRLAWSKHTYDHRVRDVLGAL